MNQFPPLGLVHSFPPAARPLAPPFTPVVTKAEGSADRLNELRDMLAGFCLLEAQKYYETAKNTPANVANLRELARIAQVVLAIQPGSGSASDSSEPFDYSILSDAEAEAFRCLRDKARGAGRAA